MHDWEKAQDVMKRLERLRMCGMEIKGSWKWKRRKMDECKSWGVGLGDRPAKCFQVMFTLCSQPHVASSFTFYVASVFSLASCTSHVYCKLEVYVCIYMCSNVLCCDMYSCLHLCKGVICMCMYVCQCVLLILVLLSAVVLLLFSCCHRNTVVAKLLLPCYHISCSLFPQWLRTRPQSLLT